MIQLELKNQTLEAQVVKYEDYSGKANLFIKGISESGPNKIHKCTQVPHLKTIQ